MNISAPEVMRKWYENNQSKKNFKYIKAELRLPASDENLNKASLLLNAKPLLCSLTIWGTGMMSYTVVNVEQGLDIL